MIRSPSSIRRTGGHNPGDDSALAAIVGHELNNIAVPMAGFADLAIGSAENESLILHLSELQTSIERLGALALALESLGEPQSVAEVVSIGSCLPRDEIGKFPTGWQLSWDCGPATPVKVDPLQAQRAILALVAFAGTPESPLGSISLVTILRQSSPIRGCVACAALIPRKRDNVLVQVESARPVVAAALTHPLSTRGNRNGGRKLTCAVLVHCAHAAGGHILLNESATLLSLVFPAP